MSRYTDEQFIEAVKNSRSIRQVLISLGLSEQGGAYKSFRNKVKILNLDISHFEGQSWNKGKTHGPKRPITEYLNNSHQTSSNCLRNRLIKEDYFKHQCCKCGLTHWLEKPILLELHHLDHNHENNNLDNLTIVCANCHAFIHKEMSKNKKKTATKYKYNKKTKGISDPNWRTRLKPEKRKVDRPEYHILLQETKQIGFCATGRKYGVTDNCIRKWIKMYEKYKN